MATSRRPWGVALTHAVRRWGLVASLLTGWSTGAVGSQAGITEDVRDHIRERVAAGNVVGIVVGLVDATGTAYFAHGALGITDPRPVDERTVFEIGSITKAFTGVLLADMVARGEVALDDPVAGLLPDEVGMPESGGRPITLLDLVTHTSALPRLPDNMSPANPANPYADYTVVQMYDFLRGHDLRRDVGSEYEYSNLAVGLLGHVLARRAGSTYEDLVLTRVAEVLGMPDTRITLTADLRDRLARGHMGGREVSNWDIPTLAGAGALRSTAADMLRFVSANLGFTESTLTEPMRASHGRRTDRPGPVGLGWHVIERDGSTIVWHNGGTGGYRAFAGFDPASRRGVVVLGNSNLSVDDIGLHLLDSRNDLSAIRREVDVSAELLERYVGEYELAPGFTLRVSRTRDMLIVRPTGQPPLRAYAESDTSFFFRDVQADITFVTDGQGIATALILYQNGQRQRATKMRRP